MAISLKISPKLIQSIATLYNDTNRIFMEYIDNALDSAENYYDASDNSYKKEISIILSLNGTTYKDGSVIIEDNCTGISNIKKVVQNIGDSDKSGQFTTNGQFGFGMYSFMAACAELQIYTKFESAECKYLPIKRKQFDSADINEVSFPEPMFAKQLKQSGTKIILSNFDKGMWKNIDIELIKKEVEKHFELLLTRKNLKIKIINNGAEYICKQFDYSLFEGDVLDEKINQLNIKSGRKKDASETLNISNNPIRIFLKITKGKNIDKLPVFIIKGRRISEIKDMKSFKSNHKGDIWGHPNLTGYIDLGGILEPTIARNDFKNNPESKAVFEALVDYESIVQAFLKDETEKTDDKQFKALEDVLNKVLHKLAKLDQLNFRTSLISGKILNTPIIEGEGISDIPPPDSEIEKENVDKAFFPGPGEKNWEEKSDSQKKEGENFSNDPDDKKFDDKEPEFDDDKPNSDERKKPGFDIQLSERDPDIDMETNTQIRSSLIGGTIVIFKKHPDFISRVEKKRIGESKITQRLITYLAGEITIHYKDKFETRGGLQPEYNKKMFRNVVDFIYLIEEALKGLEGKNPEDFNM
jgi:hypothetical protein